MPAFHFIDSGADCAAFNMAIDEALFKKASGLFVRVYAWQPSAVSMGFGQRAEKELNLPALQKDRLHIVRRPTGGRALLHDREITYSVAADIGSVFGPDLNTTFQTISACLKQVLERIGLAVQVEKGKTRDVRSKSGASIPCFSSTARYELKAGGKKLVGSAQKRGKKRFLQHGSLIIRKSRDITRYLNLDHAQKDEYRAQLEAESTCLADHLSAVPGYSDLVPAFKAGFAQGLGMAAADYALTGSDRDAVAKLEQKYRSPKGQGQ